jgi:hypothetical protein
MLCQEQKFLMGPLRSSVLLPFGHEINRGVLSSGDAPNDYPGGQTVIFTEDRKDHETNPGPKLPEK